MVSSESNQSKRPHWTFIKWLIGIIITLFGGYQVSSHFKQQREWEIEDRERDSTPDLSYISQRSGKDGLKYITILNKPGTGAALVNKILFVITDATLLARINEVSPRDAIPLSGAANHVDRVYFEDGQWDECGESYVFSVEIGLHIAPGKPNDFALGINSRLWDGFEFHGKVIVIYNDKYSLEVDEDVTIVGQSQLPDPEDPHYDLFSPSTD